MRILIILTVALAALCIAYKCRDIENACISPERLDTIVDFFAIAAPAAAASGDLSLMELPLDGFSEVFAEYATPDDKAAFGADGLGALDNCYTEGDSLLNAASMYQACDCFRDCVKVAAVIDAFEERAFARR